MCEPSTIMTVMSLASAAASSQAQHAQARVEKRRFETTKKTAVQAAGNNFNQLHEKVSRERKRIASELDIASRESLKLEAIAAVGAGEAGAGGNSTGLVLANYSKKRLEHATVKSMELEGVETNAFFKAEEISAQAHNRIAGAAPTTQAPSMLGDMFSFAGAAASGYYQGEQIEADIAAAGDPK